MQFFKPTDSRPQIVESIQAIHNRYQRGFPSSSVEFPPRFGKSTVIRGSALELRASGAPLVVCLCPWTFLADQIKVSKDILEMYSRYGIKDAPSFSSHRVMHINGANWYEMSVGVPTLLSMTVGIALVNKHAFLSGIEYCAQHFGARPVGIFDESQVVKKAQSWGGLAKEMQDKGCYIVTLTGTPVPGMTGFDDEVKETRDIAYTLSRPRRNEKGEKEWFKEEYEGKKSNLKITATAGSVSWYTAWNSKPPALEQANAVWIDTRVFGELGNDLGMLSEIDDDEVIAGFLKGIIESDDVTSKMAYAGIDRLLQKRAKNPSTRMLVVTGADVGDKGSNIHARRLKSALQDALIAQGRSPKDLRITIATSVDDNGEPDKLSVKNIDRFREGEIDVLIVKMMGLVGLDVPELKVLLYAGIVRDGPLLRQAISRPLTIWGVCNEPAVLILPRDPKMRRRYAEIIDKQGGGAPSKSEVDLVRETPIPEPPPKPLITNQGAEIFGYSDHTGREFGGGDREYILKAIKVKWHVGNLTDVEILDNYAKGGFPVSQEEIDVQKSVPSANSNVIDLDANLGSLIGRFGEKAKKIVNKYIDFGSQPELWREKVTHLQSEAKEICRERRPVPKIDDAVMLQRLIDALDEAEKAIFDV